MFTTIRDFEREWTNESQATMRVLEALTDDALAQRVAEDNRTLGRIAWHIAVTLHEMPSRTGLVFDPPGDEHRTPATAAAIRDGYLRASEALLAAVRTQWTDASLLEEHDMYGDMWTNAQTLWALVKHEIHHRGQMTVLLRQAGLRVPDLYGPVREDWAGFGMEAPAV